MAEKIAIIHDWLTGMRGGEYCLQAFLALYPDADVFTLIHRPGRTTSQIDARVVQQSFLGRLPAIDRYYRALLPLFPAAVRSLDLKGYDLIISISHAAAKNAKIPEGTPHWCYCLSPMRYIWDQARTYLGPFQPLAWPVITSLRAWDTAHAPWTRFSAISNFVAARVRCFYGTEASVLYPPVDTSWIRPVERFSPGEAFLHAGALVPYKRVDAIIQAFNRLGAPLWIAGGGPEEAKLRAIAGKNIHFFGRVSDAELAELYRNARALVFAAKEDFGMVPVECMAAGRPVIALYAGGARETVRGIKAWEGASIRDHSEPPTGVFFQSIKELSREIESGVRYFLEHEEEFLPGAAVAQASRFGVKRFVDGWTAIASHHGLAMPRNMGRAIEVGDVGSADAGTFEKDAAAPKLRRSGA